MDYATCRRAVSRVTARTGRERVSLEMALARVAAADLAARLPQPEFRQSLRDGYVLADYPQPAVEAVFPVVGMIQAGGRAQSAMVAGQACRIMTGGMVPEGGVRVIPQEDCEETSGTIRVPAQALGRLNTFIQEKGSDIGIGELVTTTGTVLHPEHISLLASVGCEEVEVYRRPRAGFFCTGSELVDTARELHPGLKVSSNRHLLDGLIRRHGAVPSYLGTVRDTATDLAEVFARLKAGEYDMVISTGGMGPGKYDLIEQSFREEGGEVIYSTLNLRPGRNSLCGIIDGTLFFGLPGPPTAVRALVNAIVGPALMQMQGVASDFPLTIHAHLEQPLTIKRPGVMQLYGGSIAFQDGRCLVRSAGRLEPSSCYLVIAADKEAYAEGELIEVQLTASPFAAAPP